MINEKSVSKAQQRFMGMVHAAQKGELDNPSSEVEKAADSMSDAYAKDYASTKHKGLPNHVKKENMEKQLKEIIRQTYRESLRESINEDATELPQATIPSAVKVKLQMAIDKIKDSKLSNNAKLQLVAQVIDALDVDKSQLSNIANKIRSKMESVNESISHEAMGIASMTNTRKEAVQKFIDDNNLDAKEILTHVTKGKLPERIRFVQALVGTPNNSSFKWYVKNYANESVVTEGTNEEWAGLDTIKRGGYGSSRLQNGDKIRMVIDARKNKYYNGVINGSSIKWEDGAKSELSLSTQAYNRGDLQVLRPTTKNESVNEGKKAFKINPPIGKAKYSISAHNGVSKHKDGSDFWDILIFKNKADLERRAKYFRGEKYIEEAVVTEGKKAFKINPPIGSSKYSISAHDGITKHKDGSPFWDILIFKNKADLERRAKYFRGEKYIEEAVIKEGVYKTILSNNTGKLFFSLVDDETDKVTDIDAKAWLKSTIKDKSSDNSKELVLSALVRQINQFNKKVDFNMWSNANKPTWEEKVKYLFDKGLANNVNKTGIKVH
jgi:hypothetical protein